MNTAAMFTLTAAPCRSGTSHLGIPRIGNGAVLDRKNLGGVWRYNPQFAEGHRSFRTTRCFLMDVVVRSGVEPGNLPSDGSPGSWNLWILGMLLSVVLPFWKNKWGPLLKLKNEVETMVNEVEHVAEVVEEVAEKVEELTDEVGDHMPEGRMKKALEVIENAADQIAEDAHRVDAFMEKIEHLENNMEKEIETIMELGPARRKSATDITYPDATEPDKEPAAAIEPVESDHNN